MLRRNLVLVAVIVLGLSAGAYAASRVGSDDLKGMRSISAEKTIKPGQRKNVKANCRKGEALVDHGFSVAPDLATDPTPRANVLTSIATKRNGKGRFPDQALLSVANTDNGELAFKAEVTGWCLKG